MDSRVTEEIILRECPSPEPLLSFVRLGLDRRSATRAESAWSVWNIRITWAVKSGLMSVALAAVSFVVVVVAVLRLLLSQLLWRSSSL